MDITFHSAVLFVKDIKVSKEFYTNILKMKIRDDFGNNVGFENGLSIWQPKQEHELSQYINQESRSKSFELYFETNQMDEICKMLEKEHIPLVHPLKTESWGQKTIRFFDPDKHIIEIGESLQSFVNRMYHEGLDIHELHQKTGIPVEQLKQILHTDLK